MFYLQELIFFALKSLAADSSRLIDFRHHPIALRLQVRPRAHTHTHTHTHKHTPAHTHTLRNETVSNQMLEEQIQAEQAARQHEQEKINQKLDLLLARLGGEGARVGTGGESRRQPKSDYGTGTCSSAHYANGTRTQVYDVNSPDVEWAIPHPLPPPRGSGAESDAHDARRWPTTSSRGLDEAAANPLSEFEPQERLKTDWGHDVEMSRRASDLRALFTMHRERERERESFIQQTLRGTQTLGGARKDIA